MASKGLETAFQGMATLSVAVLLLAPMAALQPLEWGAWRLTSGSILMMYLGGALSTLTLLTAVLSHRGGELGTVSRPVLALAAGGLVLALGGVPGALFADFPLLAFTGTYQSGLGILWFVYFASAVLLFGMLERIGSWRTGLDWALALTLASVCAARITDMLIPDVVLMLPGGDSYAYLAACGIAYAISGGGLGRGTSRAILAISAVLMAVSGNIAAVGATILIGAAILVCRGRPRIWSVTAIFQRSIPALALLLATILGPACLIYAVPAELLPHSLESRAHIHELSFAILRDADVFQLMVGLGWGHVQAAYYANLLAADFPIYLQDWDFLWRDIFHSHNAAMEALLAAGLIGLTVHCVVFWMALRQTARINRAGLWFLLLFYLMMAGLWFEYSFVLPFLALSAVRCLSDCRPEPALAANGSAGTFSGTACRIGCVAATAVFAFVFVRMVQFESAVADHKFDSLIDAPQEPIRLETFPEDPRGTHFVESIVLRELWRKRALLRESRGWTDDSGLALALLDRSKSLLPAVDASPMLLVGLSVLNDLAYYQGAEMQKLASQNMDLWQRLVQRHWALEPKRSDIAVGYFEFLKRAFAFERLQSLAKDRLSRFPEDPVAIYYTALASLHRVPAEQNPDAMRAILRAIDLGLDVILPIDAQFEQELRRQFGAEPEAGVGESGQG